MADQIVAKDEATYELAPPDQYQAVCVDVIDLGEQMNERWATVQHKIAILFQLEAVNKAGKRFEIAAKFTLSMNEKAFLRKFLGQWRGKAYSDTEAKNGVPIHKLVGVNALVSVDHTEDGKYANIIGIAPLPKAMTARLEPLNYTRSPRWAERKQEGSKSGVGSQSQGGAPSVGKAAHAPVNVNDDDFPGSMEEDDDLPF